MIGRPNHFEPGYEEVGVWVRGGINSNVLNQNDQFTYTFTTPGTYDYICSIHPFMTATVVVTP